MKSTFTIFISIFLVSVSLGQDFVYQINSSLEPKKLIFSDNDKFNYNYFGYVNLRDINKTTINSNSGAKQKLDSLIISMFYESINTWTLTNKYEYYYDENGNTSVEIGYEWDNNLNIWEPEQKTEKLFNKLNKPYEELRIYWEIDSNQWITYQKYQYEYDESGNLILEKSMKKDSTNQWVNNWKREYTYDIDFGLQSELYSIWVIDSNMFIPYYMNEYTYDTVGRIITYSKKVWIQNTMTWKDQSKSFYTYNNNDLDSTFLFLELDLVTDSLINSYKIENHYDSNGFDKTAVHYNWDKSINQWSFDNKQQSNYNSNGKKTLMIRSRWYNYLNSWFHINKTEFTYDNNGNLSLYQYYAPSDSINWHIINEYEYNYDSDYTISEIFFPIFESYPPEYCNYMLNKPTDYSIYHVYNGELYEEYNITYYYSELNNSISELPGKNIEVYPNPTSGKLTIINENEIELKEIIIYNQIGQTVIHKYIIPKIIDLSSLNQGIYIVVFVAENSLIRKKIIIKE